MVNDINSDVKNLENENNIIENKARKTLEQKLKKQENDIDICIYSKPVADSDYPLIVGYICDCDVTDLLFPKPCADKTCPKYKIK